jgi:hypothetical protein
MTALGDDVFPLIPVKERVSQPGDPPPLLLVDTDRFARYALDKTWAAVDFELTRLGERSSDPVYSFSLFSGVLRRTARINLPTAQSSDQMAACSATRA